MALCVEIVAEILYVKVLVWGWFMGMQGKGVDGTWPSFVALYHSKNNEP